jgi:TolB-like protein/tetratricopeptide (TPR) repeat protein
MLTGERPFAGDSELLVSRAILEDDPAMPSAANPEVPATLDALVRSLLAKDRDRRPRTADQVVAALGGPPSTDSHLMTATAGRALWRGRPRPAWSVRNIAVGAAVLVAVAAAVAWLATRPGERRFDRVAVMPFEDFTGDPTREHLAESVPSALLARLATIDGLSVVARSEAWGLSRAGAEPREMGRRLGADFLVEGAVSAEPGGVELTATLLDTATAEVLWSHTASGPVADLPRLQAELADRLVSLMSITTSPSERERLTDDPARRFAAYDDLVRAERALDAATDATGAAPAIELYRQSVRGDPEFALGWAGLSEALWVRGRREGRTESLVEAEDAARRSLDLEPTLPAGQVALARVLRDTGRSEEAGAELEAALAVHAHPEEVHLELAQSYRRVGDMDAAEDALRAATAVAPQEWLAWARLGELLWLQGEYEAARDAYIRSVDVAPAGVTLPREDLVGIEVSMGRFDAAIEAADRLPRPIESSNLASNIGTAFFFSDRPDRMARAEEYYRLAVRLAPRNDRVRRNLADVLAHVGRADEAREEYAAALHIVEERLTADPENPDLRLRRAFFAARSDDCVAALAWAEPLRSELAGIADAVHQLAYVDALCDRREAALDGIRTALELGVSPEIVRAEDEFASLRDDPEFRRLVGASGLSATDR